MSSWHRLLGWAWGSTVAMSSGQTDRPVGQRSDEEQHPASPEAPCPLNGASPELGFGLGSGGGHVHQEPSCCDCVGAASWGSRADGTWLEEPGERSLFLACADRLVLCSPCRAFQPASRSSVPPALRTASSTFKSYLVTASIELR